MVGGSGSTHPSRCTSTDRQELCVCVCVCKVMLEIQRMHSTKKNSVCVCGEREREREKVESSSLNGKHCESLKSKDMYRYGRGEEKIASLKKCA